jgi:hypothetical protein
VKGNIGGSIILAYASRAGDGCRGQGAQVDAQIPGGAVAAGVGRRNRNRTGIGAYGDGNAVACAAAGPAGGQGPGIGSCIGIIGNAVGDHISFTGAVIPGDGAGLGGHIDDAYIVGAGIGASGRIGYDHLQAEVSGAGVYINAFAIRRAVDIGVSGSYAPGVIRQA